MSGEQRIFYRRGEEDSGDYFSSEVPLRKNGYTELARLDGLGVCDIAFLSCLVRDAERDDDLKKRIDAYMSRT